jgi:cyclomaltodextrinase
MRRHLLLGLALVFVAPAGAAPDARPERNAEPSVELQAADAEVWAFHVQVRGRVAGLGQARCTLTRNGKPATAGLVTAGNFVFDVSLDPGRNVVTATCQRRSDGLAVHSAPVRYEVCIEDRPRARIAAAMEQGMLVLDASPSLPAEGSSAPLARFIWSRREGGLRSRTAVHLGEARRRALPLPTGDADHVYTLRIEDARGRSAEASVLLSMRNGEASIRAPGDPPPWLERAVVYGVVPPLFGRPALKAVTAQLADLQDLGINTLWLSPLVETPAGEFGYAVTDYFRVRADYGTQEDLRQLIRAAHDRGMRVLLDAVPNHTSAQHRYFEDSRQHGARSHYFHFYERTADGEPTHYFDWEHLPNLDHANAEVARFITDASVHWLRELDVDGYRVDAAWAILEREPDFFPGWIAALQRAQPEALLIAEASARDPRVLQAGFDAAYDWSEEVGHGAMEKVFDDPDRIAERLHAALMRTAKATRHPERTLRFLNNNDTGQRFISKHGQALTRVATAALLTLPGVPLLYSFDEVGAEFHPYQDGLEPVARPHNPDLRALHRRLIALRKQSSALRGQGFTPLLLDAARNLYVYLRTGRDPADIAIVALNFSEQPARVDVPLPEPLLRQEGFIGALARTRAKRNPTTLELRLAPYAAEVLVRDPDHKASAGQHGR